MLNQPTERSEQAGGNGLTEYGKGMDLSFLGKPHEYDPRRVYSTTATDWQGRVDFDRLRRDRLGRARMMMEKHDLGALVCFVGENVRYITERLPGELEEQHLHPLLRAAPRWRTGPVRDRGLRSRVREDRRAVAERATSARRSPGSGRRRPSR